MAPSADTPRTPLNAHNQTLKLIFSTPEHTDLAQNLSSQIRVPLVQYTAHRFPNQELIIKLHQQARNAHCIVVGSITPPDTNLTNYLFLCHTLHTEHAASITALLPYLAYTRQEKKESSTSHAISLLAGFFVSAGITSIITIDSHHPRLSSFFPMPVTSLYPTREYVSIIKNLKLKKYTLVSPDQGSLHRCQLLAKALKLPDEQVVYFNKTRNPQGVTHQQLYGQLTSTAIVIDDQLDTGGTLISCCQRLVEAGVTDIYIIVTHPLFTGTAWPQLFQFPIRQLYTTDTIPLNQNLTSYPITSISITELIAQYLKRNQPK